MPWRVGRDLRHLSQAAYTVLERIRAPFHPLCVIAKPLHSTRGVLWPPVVALKLKHFHAPFVKDAQSLPEHRERRYVGDPSSESVLRQTSLKQGANGSQRVSCVPPPEVLSTLNELFTRYPSHCLKLHLQRSGATHLVPYLRHPSHAPGLVLYLLESHGPDFALWTMRLANDIGYNFSLKFYSHLATSLASWKKWRDVLRLACLARQSLGYTTTALLNWRLRALAEIPHFVPVEEALALYSKERVRPSRLTYHLLISMHLRNHDLDSALTALEVMESSGFPVTDETCAIVLCNYRSLGLTPSLKSQALAALAKTPHDKVASAILNGLVQLMLDAGDMPGVIEVLSSVTHGFADPLFDRGADIIPVGDVANNIAEAAMPLHPPSSTPLRHIIDVTTYNTLLDHFAHRGDIPRAIHVLQQMRAAETVPDSRTAATLVRLYFTAGHQNDALHVVASVLEGYPEALAILQSLGFTVSILPQHPIPPPTRPSIQVLNALLRAVLKNYKLHGLHAILKMMHIIGVDADATTLSILLSHKLRRERATSREMIRIVRILMSFGVSPTMQHLHVLLGSLSWRAREVTYPRGWHVTGPAKPSETSHPADEMSVGTAKYSHPGAGITFPHHRKHGNLLRPILQSLADRGVQSDRVTFAMRIKHDALVKHDMESAKQTFRAMLDASIQPSIYHYGALMEGHAAVGDMDAAASVMQAAADAGVKADVKTHTILISGWARLARPTMAVRAFRNMIAQGIRPDVPAIDALVSAFFRVKAYGVARRVLLRLWPQVAPIPDDHIEASLRRLAVAFRALHWTNTVVREKLTYLEQQALRKTIREISRTWRVMTKTRTRERCACDVMTRNPNYNIRARGG